LNYFNTYLIMRYNNYLFITKIWAKKLIYTKRYFMNFEKLISQITFDYWNRNQANWIEQKCEKKENQHRLYYERKNKD